MKHNHMIIGLILLMFVLAQIIGLFVVNNYIDIARSASEGKTVFRGLEIAGVAMERPQVDESQSFVYMALGVIIGTMFLLLIMKLNLAWLWKFWFFLAVIICLSLSFGAFTTSYVAALLGIVLAYFKVFKPNVIVQNLSELFMYGGLAVIFVPIMNMFSAVCLLILISIYDMYAVWKSEHMIKLAKFQSSQKMFAGMLIPYTLEAHKAPKVPIHMHAKPVLNPPPKAPMIKNAILGGGDVGFPLIFAGVIMKTYGFYPGFVIIPFSAIALYILFIKGEQNKFYPAMPALSIGCLVGWAVVAMMF